MKSDLNFSKEINIELESLKDDYKKIDFLNQYIEKNKRKKQYFYEVIIMNIKNPEPKYEIGNET